eukprot:3132665-Heterocapsa_arctica.AAC.1
MADTSARGCGRSLFGPALRADAIADTSARGNGTLLLVVQLVSVSAASAPLLGKGQHTHCTLR